MVNMTGLSGISTFQELAYYTNYATDGILFIGGIVALFFVIMMVMFRNDEPFINVLAASSWITFIISAFFWLAQLTPTMLSLVFLFLAGFSTLYMYASPKP